MEIKTEQQEMLDKLLFPAFLVNNGVIVYANQAAATRRVCVKDSIETLISSGYQEYAAFTSGRLSLTLMINGVLCLASVVKYENMDLFFLESDFEDAELRAFALASLSLREPLSEAMSTINSIKQLDTAVPPALEAKLQKITRNLHQFHRTLCNMADVSSYDQVRISRIEHRDIVGVVNEIMEKATSTISSGGHILEYSGLSQPVFGIVDIEKLERSVLNLISNAIKYSPKKSTVAVSLHQNNNTLYFSVKNELSSGSDSPDSNLFMRYLREPGFESQGTGVGLGLTMTRKAACSHGGTLLFEQPDSKHICFTMSIAVKSKIRNRVQSPVMLPMDYTGGFDHLLVELADILPADAFE